MVVQKTTEEGGNKYSCEPAGGGGKARVGRAPEEAKFKSNFERVEK